MPGSNMNLRYVNFGGARGRGRKVCLSRQIGCVHTQRPQGPWISTRGWQDPYKKPQFLLRKIHLFKTLVLVSKQSRYAALNDDTLSCINRKLSIFAYVGEFDLCCLEVKSNDLT